MSLRPNIESFELDGKDLVVRGESDDPLPEILRVVVTAERGHEGRSLRRGCCREEDRDRLAVDSQGHRVHQRSGGDDGHRDSRRPVRDPLVGPVRGHRVARHGAGPDPPGGRFGVLVPNLKPCGAGEPEIDALVKSMRAREDFKAGRIPAGFTYLGQFIDHDITFDPTPFGARSRPARRRSTTGRRGSTSTRSTAAGPPSSPISTNDTRPGELLLAEGPPRRPRTQSTSASH